jgi:hypothetical protein
MKQLLIVIVILAAACTSKKKIPDVSDIKIDLQTVRFEHAFFSVDTSHMDAFLQQLFTKYPGFTQDFLYNILGAHQQADSVIKDVKAFTSSYKSLHDTALLQYKNIGIIEKEVKQGLQFVHYYFPKYPLPKQLITFIGPINSYGNIITQDGLAVGLQLYMGNNYSLYQSEAFQNLYPAYVSRRFEASYIPVNCLKTIVDDLYPLTTSGKPLIEQMIETGKRLYLLTALTPHVNDTLTTGYSEKQLATCYKNESNIWAFFIENNLLYESDPNKTNMYVNDGPNTPDINAETPGFIGQFVGWQIVKKWVDKNAKITLPQLLATPAKKIFEEARYKPK